MYRPQMVMPEQHPQIVRQEHQPHMAPPEYRPEMTTPDVLNMSQSVFFPSDQWTASLLQWAMTEDAPASSQVTGDEGARDQGVRDDGVADEGAVNQDQGVGDEVMVGEGGRIGR